MNKTEGAPGAAPRNLQRAAIFLLLLAFWFAVSGHYVALTVTLGAASAALVTALSSRMRVIGVGQHRPVFYLKLPFYALWLAWRVVVANCDVARRILHPKLPISPCFVEVEAVRGGDLLRVVQANSITLTPGTISADFGDGVIRVHALTTEAAEKLRVGSKDAGRMAAKVLRLQ